MATTRSISYPLLVYSQLSLLRSRWLVEELEPNRGNELTSRKNDRISFDILYCFFRWWPDLWNWFLYFESRDRGGERTDRWASGKLKGKFVSERRSRKEREVLTCVRKVRVEGRRESILTKSEEEERERRNSLSGENLDDFTKVLLWSILPSFRGVVYSILETLVLSIIETYPSKNWRNSFRQNDENTSPFPLLTLLTRQASQTIRLFRETPLSIQ